MPEAMKYDGEKVRLDLLPVEPIIEIGKVLTYGARKYKSRNWESGLDWSRCYAAALRHLLAWQNGETKDNETKLNHLAHAACEILFLLEFAKTHPERDDRPTSPEIESSETAKPSWADLVEEFNEAFGVINHENINIKEFTDSIKLQMKLVNEEYNELDEAVRDWLYSEDCEYVTERQILDAICDSIYVLIGLALKLGMDVDGAFREVHRSNMSKLGADGKPIRREDGKILKGPNFTEPFLDPYL